MSVEVISMKIPVTRMPHVKEEKWEEDDIYSESTLGNFTDNDMISPLEEGFMHGYLST